MPFTDWVSLANATTYFSTRAGASDWATLSDPTRTIYLTTAYNRIYFDPRWTIPAIPSAEQKIKLAYALEETALYLYTHVEDENRRKGLQAQGVTQAGIVKETYDKDFLSKIPLPPEAEAVLESLFTSKKRIYAIDIDRREPVGADQDVIDIDNSLNDPGVY